MNAPLTLRDLVSRARGTRQASGRGLAKSAQDHGFDVTFTTLNAIAAGTYKSKPSGETIRAIAWLAGVTDEEAFTAAGLPMPGPPFAQELPPDVDYLSPRSRKAVVEVARALLEAEREDGGGHVRSASNTQPSPAGAAGHLRAVGGSGNVSGTNVSGTDDPGAAVQTGTSDNVSAPHEDWTDDVEHNLDELAAREGDEDNPPDTTTGEHNQDPGGNDPA